MKSDVIQYERTYHLLKSRIESGILPVGTKLPGRSILCRELKTSERTVRHALELLEQDGFLEISPRKRPVVISDFAALDGRALQRTRKTDAGQVNDLLKTAILLCYPIYMQGLRLCRGDDWRIPEAMFQKMAPEHPDEFWQLSTHLWRFFIARNENELLVRVVDSLGFQGKEPLHDSLKDRVQYCSYIEKLFQTVKNGSEPDPNILESIFSQYKTIAKGAKEGQFQQLLSPCPMLAEADGLEQQLILAQERYSSVCLDLLGLIATGQYHPGDKLPTHDQLQKIYHVSRDTSVKAIRMLRKWGVVTAAPRRGISVVMDLEGLKKIHIEPVAIACHVRRYLDSLDLLSLTVKQVAAHAAAYMEPEAVEILYKTLLNQWKQSGGHQIIPRTLLDFITEHIQYDALRTIYEILARNFSIGRSIPQLVSPYKNSQNSNIYRKCIEAVKLLMDGDIRLFAKAAAQMYKEIQSLVIDECKQLGYWDAAMKVYDGKALWN